MSQIEVERFLGRLITDADFRVMVSKAPERTCYREGISLTQEEMSFLKQIDYSPFGVVAEAINGSILRK